jgi:ABC-type nitrate/sulfonate/bicarbonate transport system substrate-binding protein
MPLVSQLGRDSFTEPLVTVMGLGCGGNAITVRKELFEAGVKSAADLSDVMKAFPGLGRLMIGHVFGSSMHHYLLREWLAFDAGAIIPLGGPQPHALYTGFVWNVGCALPRRRCG